MIEAAPAIGDVARQLARLLELGTLPERARLAAQTLFERLNSPVRVVLLGHPESGKSSLLNLIAGERVIPDDAHLPTFELRHGAERRLVVLHPDGREEIRDPVALSGIGHADGIVLRMEAPNELLKTITLTEVVAEGGAEDEKAAVRWATERADIVLWCSQEFTTAERWLWSSVPERLKDHGFLILTKADEMIHAGTLGDRIRDLSEVVAEEFLSLVPVATLQGLETMGATDSEGKAAYRASGAPALVGAILKHVDQGRRADMDAALMLLARFGSGLPHDRTVDAPSRAAKPAPAATGPEATAAPAKAAEVPPADRTRSRIPSAPAPAAVAAGADPSGFGTRPAEPPPPAQTGGVIVQLSDAMDILSARTEALSHDVDVEDVDAAQGLVARCAEIAEEISGIVDAAGPGLDGAHPGLREGIMEAAEMLILMQAEAGLAPAADAVTVLLQVRRDIGRALAA